VQIANIRHIFGREDITYLPQVIVLYHWKSAIDVGRIATLHTPVIIHRKDKCVQNAISLFIGLLTTIMTTFPRQNSMNLKEAVSSSLDGRRLASVHKKRK
jgi:hypothetical protein